MKKIYLLFTCLMASLLLACSDEGREGMNGEKRVCRMVFDGTIQGFDSGTRAAGVSLQQGAVMYLALDNLKTTATCDGSQWLVTIPDGLADGAKGSCTAYYIENPSTTSGTSIKLTSGSVVFSGTGSYSNSTEAFTVSATLTPLTSRVRFRGTSGTQVTVSGLQGYSSFDNSTYALGNTTSPLTLMVRDDGSTPYVYALPTSDRSLTVNNGAFTYTRSLGSDVMQQAHSGYFDIPTQASHAGWTSDERTETDFSGDDYDGDADWNQPDPEPSQDNDFSGDDDDDDEDWNMSDETPSANGREYVDLGLSVKWATCNVGAEKPEDYGDYFAWGETTGYNEGKTDFSWNTYKWCNGSRSFMTKYCTSSSYGTVDNKKVLEPEDDVAHVKWGGSWRMPTIEECDELCDNCTWTWTTQNGVKGCKVTSKTNGNSIFLPAAGFRDSSNFSYAGSGGGYRSSSLDTSYSYFAYELYFYSGDVSRSYDSRYYGRSVRPVCP